MSCCGQQRAALLARSNGVADQTGPVRFSYTGVRAIIVKGAATGRVYRFLPGGWLSVHGGDAASMREIPGLRPENSHS